MRSAMLVLLTLGLLAASLPVEALHRDLLVQGEGPASLQTYDIQGEPALACDVPAALVTVKLLEVPQGVSPFLTRSQYAVVPIAGVPQGSDPSCAVVPPLSVRVGFIDESQGNWEQGWTFFTYGPADTIALHIGPYGDGSAIPFWLQHTTRNGVPVLDVRGVVRDPLAGA